MAAQKTIVFLRADGNSEIGLGHVHRLLALSEILSESFECKFVIHAPLQGVRELILRSCHAIVELSGTFHPNELMPLLNGREIVVLDGYHFDTTYQRNVKQKGSTLVCIDDIHKWHFVSDVIINPAGGVTSDYYSKESYTTLFTGPRYSLQKKIFNQAARHREKRSSDSLLICMGGADQNNHTLATLRQCQNFSFSAIYIVIGEAYPHAEALYGELSRTTQKIKILSNITAYELAEVMKECGVAVCSASGIAYEYLCVGGELYIKETASNQRDLYHYIIQSKLAFPFENFRIGAHDFDISIQAQSQIFDGYSNERILKIFNRLDFESNSSIRMANATDLMTIFHWANDPDLRAQSFNSDPITMEKHLEWFNRKINDPFTILFVFEYKNSPVGQVRFDLRSEATISYSIDRSFRGRSWGEPILRTAIETLEKKWKKPMMIIGYVKKENASSNKIFKNLGFIQRNAQEYPDSYRYELPTTMGN